MLIQDYLDICDPVLTFDRFMGEIELEKYLKNIPQHYTGRLRYDPVSMLKTVLFGFMANGYISLRELEDQCKVNLRFMYLMDHQAPSYRTFGYFINEVLADSIEEIFQDINKKIFETEHVDLQHLYIDGSKFEANANKYSWVWKKATEKSRYRLFGKITTLFEEINEELSCTGMKLCINSEYAPEYLKEAAEQYAEVWQINEAMFVHGSGHRKTTQQRHYEKLKEYAAKLEEYVEKIKICGEDRNSYSKTDHSATFMRIKTDYMGNALDFNGSVLHLCNFCFKQTFHQFRMCTGNQDLWSLRSVLHFYNVQFNAICRFKHFSFDLLIFCEHGICFTQIDTDIFANITAAKRIISGLVPTIIKSFNLPFSFHLTDSYFPISLSSLILLHFRQFFLNICKRSNLFFCFFQIQTSSIIRIKLCQYISLLIAFFKIFIVI